MFIIDFFKTMSAVKQAKKFVKAHEGTVNTVKGLISKIQTAITWFENHKADIEAKIADAKATVEKLKGFLNK